MFSFKAGKVEVKFPYNPLDQQKQIASGVVQSILKGQNAFIESPTGTGKTLALLCSSLAAIKFLHLENHANVFLGAPKIIYASRTADQLSQAAKAFKSSPYNGFEATMILSRDFLCVNEKVLLKEKAQRTSWCLQATETRSCEYYEGYIKTKGRPFLKNINVGDIEDIVTEGKKKYVCPYFSARANFAESSIIFLPYAYLLDCRAHVEEINLKGNILIIDEAHNLASSAEEAMSFCFHRKTMEACLQVVKEVELRLEIQKKAQRVRNNKRILDFSVDEARKLEKYLSLFQEILQQFSDAYPKGNSARKFCEMSSRRGVDQNLIQEIVEFLTRLREVTNKLGIKSSPIIESLDPFTVLKIGFTAENAECFFAFPSCRGGNDHRVSFTALMPCVGVRMLLSKQPRAIILASGTLPKFETLSEYLELPLPPVQIHNDHFINDKQLLMGIVTQGRNRFIMSSKHENRENPEYHLQIGGMILELLDVIPNGVIVFFPSKSFLNVFKHTLVENGLWELLESLKDLFVEDEQQFSDISRQFKLSSKSSRGACLFSVFRGRASEGVDFRDDECRATLIFGTPFPSAFDPRVLAKRHLLDHTIFKELNGDTWYNGEAMAAVAQAAGRVIRHKEDYGIVLFCDVGFSETRLQHFVPGWMKSRLTTHTFEDYLTLTKWFFSQYESCSRTSVFTQLELRKSEGALQYVKPPVFFDCSDDSKTSNTESSKDPTLPRAKPKRIKLLTENKKFDDENPIEATRDERHRAYKRNPTFAEAAIWLTSSYAAVYDRILRAIETFGLKEECEAFAAEIGFLITKEEDRKKFLEMLESFGLLSTSERRAIESHLF